MTTTFRELALSPELLEVVLELGFETPTPVQAKAIPILLERRDLIAEARTGSGKTAAYALPILQHLDMSERVPRALVLCPTRELGAQVARDFRRFGRKFPGLRVLVLAGGEPRRRQTEALNEGAHILVGTPGRVLDHLRRGDLKLDTVKDYVLDEADRMLDMGFDEDMNAILDAAPKKRHVALFSATFPRSIDAMIKKHQESPVRIRVAMTEEERTEIRHFVMMVEAEHKLRTLRWVLDHHPHESALVFTNFKASAAEVATALSERGVSSDTLHGDLEQYDRDRVMAKFRNKSTRVLVATDVAARGLDIAGLDLVVNYELPSQPEVYMHRTGRTGRAGKAGVAISFATSKERVKLEAIEATLGTPLERTKRTKSEADAEEERAEPKAAQRLDPQMDTIRIGGGRKDKVRPGDILGALTGEAGGLAGTDVGKIEIHDTYAYVAVSRSVSAAALKSLSAGKIKGRRFRVALES